MVSQDHALGALTRGISLKLGWVAMAGRRAVTRAVRATHRFHTTVVERLFMVDLLGPSQIAGLSCEEVRTCELSSINKLEK